MDADPERLDRASRLLGWIAGGLAASWFLFPSRAFPLESLVGCVFGALVVAVALANAASTNPRGLVRALTHPAVLALGLFSFWSLARWAGGRMPVTPTSVAGFPPGEPPAAGGLARILSAGRPGAIASGLMIPAAVAGLAIAVSGARAGALSLAGARRVLVLAGLCFAAHGLYQYGIGYERDMKALREEVSDPDAPSNLMDQSLLHALREKRVGGRLGNGNLFAALLATLGGVALAGRSLPSGRPRATNALAWSAWALCLFAILLSRSRGGMLTALLATAWGWKSGAGVAGVAGGGTDDGTPGRARFARSRLAIAAAILGASVVAGALGFFDRLGKADSVRERLHYWRVAADIWRTAPLTGAGGGAFPLLYPTFKPGPARESRYAHSWPMHLGAETGLIGVGLFALFVAATMTTALPRPGATAGGERESARGEFDDMAALRREGRIFAGAFALLAFNGLFEYGMQTREFLMLAAFLGGAAAGARVGVEGDSADGAPGKSAPPPTATRARAIPRLAVAVLLLGPPAAWSACLVPGLHLATFREWEARVAARAGDPDAAAENYALAIRWTPDNEGLVAGRAAMLAASGPVHLEEAFRLLGVAARLNPLSAGIASERADLASRAGLNDDASRFLDRAVELHPRDAGHRIERARFRLARGDREGAAADLATLDGERMPVWPYLKPELESLRAALAPVGADAGAGAGVAR